MNNSALAAIFLEHFFIMKFSNIPESRYTLIRYVYVSVSIHFQERFQINAFSMKTLSVLMWTEDRYASKCARAL